MLTVADRLRRAMDDREVSQSALARAIGATQGAISLILLGKTTNSRLLPKISTVLGVSLAWLLGMADDPDETITTPPAPVQIMLPVSLPSENALADMFEGMLLAIDRAQSLDAVARELAQLLPTGLSTLQGRLIELPRPPRASGPAAFPGSAGPAAAEAPAPVDHEFQQ